MAISADFLVATDKRIEDPGGDLDVHGAGAVEHLPSFRASRPIACRR